jgi:hypothetical protein
MKNLDSLKKDLTQVADIVNAFKSESVQLKVLEYILETIIEDADETEEPPTIKHRRITKREKGKPFNKGDRKGRAGRPPKKGRPGAAVILEQLLQSGFFNKKRTIAEIISHAGSKLGYHYKPNELSTPLIRFIRDEKLDREKNAENQFEYFKK